MGADHGDELSRPNLERNIFYRRAVDIAAADIRDVHKGSYSLLWRQRFLNTMRVKASVPMTG